MKEVNENNLYHYLALNQLQRFATQDIDFLNEKLNSNHDLFKLSSPKLIQLGFSENFVQQIKKIDWKLIDKELDWASKKNHHIIICTDKRYPALLREISAAPILLYMWGSPEILSQSQLAMVGSRHPTPIGLEIAMHFAERLAQKGLVITSGLARGIDAASHEGALKMGSTVAVLGTGLENIYPKEHLKLANQIAEQGAVISEFPLYAAAHRKHFPKRNRIISGLSLGVLVIEAAAKSGSLITARFAGEQGREVFAIPGSIHNPLSRGCHRLIREGAKLVESIQDVIDELNMPTPESAPEADFEIYRKKSKFSLDENHYKLLSCIGFEVTAVDVVIVRSGMTPETISPILLNLELQGYVKSIVGGYCRMK